MTRYRYKIINLMGNPKPVFFVHSRPVSWNPIPATVQQVTLADGTPVRVNNQTWDYGACKCLGGLQIRLTKFEHEITIDFQDIRFKCMSPNAKKPTEHKAQIQKCLQRMRDGKCPYKLARQLYTGIKQK